MSDRFQRINRLIKAAWLLALLVVVGMAAWPPWALNPYDSSKKQSLGYHAIWSAEQTVRRAAPPGSEADPIAIDLFHLIIQCYVTGAVALGATFLLAVFRPEKS